MSRPLCSHRSGTAMDLVLHLYTVGTPIFSPKNACIVHRGLLAYTMSFFESSSNYRGHPGEKYSSLAGGPGKRLTRSVRSTIDKESLDEIWIGQKLQSIPES